ncbi:MULTISPECIES: hypothetical protein [unclassified Bradyrhizobium]|uniref:hypothetical protein n=1 Tax=unclassified Bradyrhizobium TaxID=2631580 RepID=UPI0028E93ED6|nr:MULTISPECIES: hypothetical protein [unclassified Bradyrhizobium]
MPMHLVSLWLVLCFGNVSPGHANSWLADGNESSLRMQTGSYQAYVDRIIAVEKDLGPVASPVAGIFLSGPGKPWFNLASFEKLRRFSAHHSEFAIRFISEPGQPISRRAIATWAMLGLPTPDYVSFLQRMIDLRDQDLISLRELRLTVWPFPPDAVVCDYTDPNLQAALRRILALGDLTPEFRSNVVVILSGKVSEIQKRGEPRQCLKLR